MKLVSSLFCLNFAIVGFKSGQNQRCIIMNYSTCCRIFAVRHRRNFGRCRGGSFQLQAVREDVREGLEISRDHGDEPIGRAQLGRKQQLEVG